MRRTGVNGRTPQAFQEKAMFKGLLLWLIGIPIPIIILLWLIF